MNKLLLSGFLGVMILTVVACKKDNSTNTSGNNGTVYFPTPTSMSAKVDDTTFSYNVTAVSSSSGISTLYLSNTDLNIALSLIAANNTTPGTYTIGNTFYPSFGYNNNGTYFQATSGTVIVSSNDTVHQVMKGSFSGVVTNFSNSQTHTITNGTFVMNYQ